MDEEERKRRGGGKGDAPADRKDPGAVQEVRGVVGEGEHGQPRRLLEERRKHTLVHGHTLRHVDEASNDGTCGST